MLPRPRPSIRFWSSSVIARCPRRRCRTGRGAPAALPRCPRPRPRRTAARRPGRQRPQHAGCVLLHHQQGPPLAPQRLDQLEHHVHQHGGEAKRGFVHHHQPGFGHERPGDGQLLGLAAREVARGHRPLLPQHREPLAHLIQQLSPLVARLGDPADLEVLLHREIAEDPPVFGHQRHAQAQQLLRRLTGDVGSLEGDRSGRRGKQPGDGAQKGGLPSAVGSDEAHHLTGPDVEVGVSKR